MVQGGLSHKRYLGWTFLDVLGGLLVVDRDAARGGLGLGQFLLRAMDALLENGLGLVDVEFGLEVAQVVAEAAAIGAAAGVGQVEALVMDLLACVTPMAPLLACSCK